MKPDFEKMIEQIKEFEKNLSEERDKIDKFIDEATCYKDVCDEALEELHMASYSLSRFV